MSKFDDNFEKLALALDSFCKEMDNAKEEHESMLDRERQIRDKGVQINGMVRDLDNRETRLKEQEKFLIQERVEVEKGKILIKRLDDERKEIDKKRTEIALLEKESLASKEYSEKLTNEIKNSRIELGQIKSELASERSLLEKEKQIDILRKETLDAREKKIKQREEYLQRLS